MTLDFDQRIMLQLLPYLIKVLCQLFLKSKYCTYIAIYKSIISSILEEFRQSHRLYNQTNDLHIFEQFLIHTSNQHGEGNGTPLQYSCLENPMDGGAW